MFNQLRNKKAEKAERRRLTEVFSEFEKEYWALCRNYNAQFQPYMQTDSTGKLFQLRMQLVSYTPPVKVVDKPPVGNGKPEPEVQKDAKDKA